jgi:hypothetical protein
MERGEFFDEDKEYDPAVVRVARGERDRVKQDAVYVGIDRRGRVKSTPTTVTRKAAHEEYQRAERYLRLVNSLVTDERRDSEQFRKLRESLRIVYWQRLKPIELSKQGAT